MLTDWVLIHRLAVEIEERLRGARADDAGLLADGRIGLLFRRRGEPLLLAIDPFASPPLVTLEEEELGIAAEPGFVRALARALRGMVLKGASSRRGDRLIRLRFAARSSFGVGEELDLYLELVPRYGNAVLVKGGTVVAALKEFGLAENPRRAVQAGASYELPPLPARITKIAGSEPANLDEVVSEPLYVYRREGELLAAYVTPLEGFDDARMSRESSLLEILRELRGRQAVRLGNERGEARRRAILKRLGARERKAHDELERLKEKRRRAELRDELRAQGDGIFATLHELDDGDREAAKERAGELFAQYKRLAKSVPHVDARSRAVAASLDAIEMLTWEAERAGDDDLEAVETAVAQLVDRRAGRAVAPAPKRRRKRSLLEFRTQHGSRIVVGRSPMENDELTFRLARPNDLWFHARGVPGAHVILAREDHAAAPDDDLRAAASLAAFHSRARAANSVDVDYAPRKHVRKRRAAPPGLVWYTQARTIAVTPKPTA
jgi:predicted ribosome quality control (RQC) complex YloA/Tae2 family protein